MMSGRKETGSEENHMEKILQRYTYQPPSDNKSPAGKEMDVITSYMRDTLLQDTMNNLLHMLLSMTKLPYNPYPGFVRRIRAVAEGFQVFDMTSISTCADSKIMKTSVAGMYGLQGCDNVWGLKHMVNVMNGKGLKRYDWLIQDATPKGIAGIGEHSEYTGQILVALLGPAAFTGSFYENVNTVDIRLEYVIYGPDVTEGLDLFVNSIVEDIEVTLMDACPHQLLGVSVPVAGTSNCGKSLSSSSIAAFTSRHLGDKSNPATSKASHAVLLKPDRSLSKNKSSTSSWRSRDSTSRNSARNHDKPELWATEDILTRRDEFVREVHKAVKQRQVITLQCVFAMNKEKQYIKQGSKQYVLHFVKTKEDSDEESLFSFGKLPFLTLHEGVFLKKADCETYLMTMNRHSRIAGEIESAEIDHESDIRARQMGTANDDDGFEETVPYLDIVVAPIKLQFEDTLSSLDPVMDAFKVVHLILNIMLLERTRSHIDVLVEIQRFLHSTAHQWHIVMCHNTMIQQVVQYVLQCQGKLSGHGDMLTQAIKQYRGTLLHVLHTSLSGQFADQHTVTSVIKSKLLHLSSLVEYDDIHYQQVTKHLMSLQLYCTTIYLQLLDDASSSYLRQISLQDAVKKSQNIPSDVKACLSKADVKKKSIKTPIRHQTSTSPAAEAPVVVLHGVENKRITQQRHIFVDVEAAKQDSRWPTIIVDDAVLIQYLVDVKLDQVWQEFLLDLFSKSWLPPNPYPSLVANLRQAALRMQLCQETNEQLAHRLLHFKSVKPTYEINGVCTIPGYNMYGCVAALAGLDTNASGFPKITVVTKGVSSRLTMTRKGQYQVFHGTAVSDLCPLYGQLVPYLTHLVLHEQYYIKGPMGAHSEAIRLFAKLVFEQVTEILDQNHVILDIYLGESDLFHIQQILDNKEQFMSCLMQVVHQKQDIFVKFYQVIGWRYLCIVKYFRFHYLYVHNAEDRCEPFYPFRLLHLYQSVFLNQKEANFHFRQVKCIAGMASCNLPVLQQVNGELDEQIRATVRDDHDMMKVYKLLLTRALINKDEESIAELWRVLHSVAYQLDYVNYLNLALQDLIHVALENADHSRVDKPSEMPPMEVETLLPFYKAYKDKVLDVIQDPCAFASVSLTRLVETKLGEIGEAKPISVSGILIDNKNIGILQDITDLLQPLQDIIAEDMLNICPQTHGILEQVMVSRKM